MPRRSKLPKPRFYLKEPSSKVPTAIFLIYSYGGEKTLKYSTGEEIHPKYWNQKNQEFRSSRKYEDYKDTEKRIEEIRRVVLQVYREKGAIERDQFALELDYRLGFRQRENEKKVSMFKHIEKIVSQKEKATLEDKRKNPQKRYYHEALRSWMGKFKAYETWSGTKLTWEAINWEWLQSFTEWCFVVNNFSIGHSGKGVSIMKQFVNQARKDGLTKNRIVNEKGFAIKKAQTTKVVFFLDDFERLYEMKEDIVNDPKHFKVWSLIFIGGFTGMRYNMWKKIDKSLVRTIEGERFLEIWTSKTNQQVAIPLDPMLEEVMDLNDWVVPNLSQQRFSDYAKELWRKAGITERFEKVNSRGGIVSIERKEKWELFHPHSLRRSFASNFYLMGIPASWLMPITGHSSEKQFFHYINIEKRLNAKHVSRYMKQLATFRTRENPNMKIV